MIISVNRLGKRFQREWIFRNITHRFEPGIHAIVGPNGSGKSTLLHVLWGQMPPSEGELAYEADQVAIPVEEFYRYASLAAPYIDLPDQFTAEEILGFHFKFKKARLGSVPREWLDLLELSHARNTLVKDLSSGMKQRLKIGMAILSECQALFLDEPTTNFDDQARAWYHQMLSGLSSSLIVFIATNIAEDYPPGAKIFDIRPFKLGYNPLAMGI